MNYIICMNIFLTKEIKRSLIQPLEQIKRIKV
jgi:hypothetical protein